MDIHDKSISMRLCRHFRMTNSNPSADWRVAVQPDKKRCSRSQAGTRTRLELDMEVHPRTSSNRSLWAFFSMRSMEALSIEVQLLGSTAILNSSSWGNPGELAWSFSDVVDSRIKLLVKRRTRILRQPCCSCSMLIQTVSRVAVRRFDKSSRYKLGHETWKAWIWQ